MAFLSKSHYVEVYKNNNNIKIEGKLKNIKNKEMITYLVLIYKNINKFVYIYFHNQANILYKNMSISVINNLVRMMTKKER